MAVVVIVMDVVVVVNGVVNYGTYMFCHVLPFI